MEQWQVGPVPEYVYSNSTHPPNAMHPRRNFNSADGLLVPCRCIYIPSRSSCSCQGVHLSFLVYVNANPACLDSNNPYQATDMAARRNERIEFPYPAQPGMPPHQQQHPPPVQPSMNVPQPQQPPSGPGSQQQTPTPTPQPSRQRKRPAPGTAPSPATPAAVPVVAPGQPPIPTPPNAQSAPPPAAPPAAEDSTPSQPPAKKSRTNTPWTPAEELRLKQMRDAGNSWAEIAKTFPTRTEGSVKKHWYKDMHYAEFAEDESQALLNAIKDYENNKWKVIGQKVGKPAKACEQYAKEHFPDLFASTKR
ncbi:MYB DNA-binding domain [Cordyceps militaris]|uniref:MYB DNA-binding domain n=1 Tax=Cordyceps militaris TaxID=73501 RepID=A0A2H4SIP8_CORMI|nr:MYB DNA-binding domain [Cordyceps militaris]